MLKNRPPRRDDAQGELHRDSWRVFQIMAEFGQGFEQLPALAPCVSLLFYLPGVAPAGVSTRAMYLGACRSFAASSWRSACWRPGRPSPPGCRGCCSADAARRRRRPQRSTSHTIRPA
jgi:hypothetical protein